VAGYANTVPAGVYRGRGCGIAAIEAYEQFLGGPVTFVEDFMIEKPATWEQFESGALTTSADVSVWQGQLGSRRLVLGVPACAGASVGTDGAKSWYAESLGYSDTHWTALGNRLVSLGFADAVLRIGREFNGSWYPWQVVDSAVSGNAGNVNDQANYIAGYQHILDVLRAVSGQQFTFNWNPYIGTGNLTASGTESCYPGDGYVDEIGLDVYDGDWSGIYGGSAAGITPAQQQQVFGKMLTEWDSVRGWYSLALNHGKTLTFPEWGLRLWEDSGVYHGGGDNAVLVRGMAEFIGGAPAGWHAMWEDPWGAGVSDPDTLASKTIPTPMARAAFLDAFRR
jgi:hypothetical protein